MDDLISRQAAMAYPLSWEHYDKEHGNRHFIFGVESYREYIESLPSAQQWIPVEKETPILPNIVLVCDSLGKILFDSYIDGSWTYCPYVVAWMPLPEPYKGDEK